jgi:hypothetical protein
MFSLPPENEHLAKLEKAGLSDLARVDPVRVLFNALLPFAVASLEGFFSQAFVILIRHDKAAREHFGRQTRKVEFEEALAVSRGERTLEEVVASWYSFQNIASLQKAFSEWLGLDFRKILRDASAAGDQPLDEVLAEIIQRRHRIIHQLDLDFDVRRDHVAATMRSANAIIDAFVDHLETACGMVIRDATVLRLMGEDT